MKKLLVTIWVLLMMLGTNLAPISTFADNASIPQNEIDRIDQQHINDLAACQNAPNREQCVSNANAIYDNSINEAEQAEEARQAQADAEAAQADAQAQEQADAEAADAQAQAEAQAKFNEDCYGYPNGDTQDSSDFALKVDCILNTDAQDESYFQPGWNSAPIENVIIKAINYLMVTIGSVSLLLIVIAGLMMITSPGNENQRSKATEILTSSIIALVIAFSSYIIVNAVEGLFF